MKLRELELLHSLFATGSVSDSARALHMSQPNASKLLKKLEGDLGFLLFERINGRLHPTEEARLLSDQAERTLHSLRRFHALAEDVREMQKGSLLIGGLPLLSREWLPDVLARFIHQHPGVETSLHTRSSKKLIEWVADRQIDIALGMLTVEDPMVECTVLTSIEFVAAIPKGHPLTALDTVTARDLHGQEFISLSVLDHTRDQITRCLREVDAVPIERTECSLPSVAIQLVERGVGIALVDHISASQMRLPNVVYRRFTPTFRKNVWLMRPRMRPQSRLADDFATLLHDTVREQDLSQPSDTLFGVTGAAAGVAGVAVAG
jgi:DNA-binding transcriptional LysR family regulator